jgi:NTP pyrophosphatase (non-canonical NTP hydrolase)
MSTEAMIRAIGKELDRAREKFPEQTIWVTLAALTEEVGELNQAVLQFNQQPRKGVTHDQIYDEAVQVAVMAIRVALDCSYKA